MKIWKLQALQQAKSERDNIKESQSSTNRQNASSIDNAQAALDTARSNAEKSVKEAQDVFAVPYDAVHEDHDGNTYINAVGDSGNEKVCVQKGMESDYYVEISGDALTEGLRVVIPTDAVTESEEQKDDNTTDNMRGKNGFEAVILCLVGGCLGVVGGISLGGIAAATLGYPTTAPVAASLAAVGFSMAVGVFFGFYPANKAAGMNPVDALRYE